MENNDGLSAFEKHCKEMELKEELNKIKENEELTFQAYMLMGKDLFQFFLSMKDNGFTDKQAFELVKVKAQEMFKAN